MPNWNSFLASSLVLALSIGASGGEISCRLELPMAIRDLNRLSIDPIACTMVEELHVWASDPLPKGMPFAYGNTACLACVDCGCLEGFVSNGRIFDYSRNWTRDSASGTVRIDSNTLVYSSGSDPAISVYDRGFGPVILESPGSRSVCWISMGDSLLATKRTNRILHCLTRTDGSTSFSLSSIRVDKRLEIPGRISPRSPGEAAAEGTPAFEVDGRRNPCPQGLNPRFNPVP